MELVTAIKKYEKHLREDVIWSYQDPDKFIYINEHDEDLQTWRVRMPDPPDWARLINFGKHANDQVFEYEEYPTRLLALEDEVKRYINKTKLARDTDVSLNKKYQEEIWRVLRRKKSQYQYEINWIRYQWWFRLYGKWMMIKGRPVYIDGWNWFFLNYWPLEGTGQLPEYRSRDMKWFHAQRYAMNSTETVEYSIVKNSLGHTKKKLIFLDDGTLKMKDVGYKTLFGTNNLKGRRVGETSKACGINYCIGTAGNDVNCGLQGNSENTAEDVYNEKLLYAFNRMPFFFVPEHPNLHHHSGLNFNGLDKRSGLNSKIVYATTARKEFFDQKRLDFYQCEECFGEGTKVLMADGSIKNIESIVVGDYVFGEDGKPKRVLKTNNGISKLYDVDYKKGDGFVCNGSHILKTICCLRQKSAYKEITALEYSKIKNYHYRKHYAMYKSTGIDFPEQKHDILPPYFIGLYIGDGVKKSFGICNEDDEIIDYCKNLASKYDLDYVVCNKNIHSFKGYDELSLYDEDENKIGVFSGHKECEEKTGIKATQTKLAIKKHNGRLQNGCFVEYKKIKNVIREELIKSGLQKKKFFPREYLFDSFENRMQLLAGIIDSDGSLLIKNNKPTNYEIIQKHEYISIDIKFLAQSLGFFASCRPRKVSMKRKDGSVYNTIAYRVCIYGDLYKIPCKVKRKKAKNVKFNWRRRDPLRFGFTVKPIGIGKYYGITVEGSSFLLQDFTVVHNCGKTKLENVIDRHGVVKRCCTEGALIKGFMIYTSTAEDMEADAGILFERLSEDSMFEERLMNGQTKSGLINTWFPMYESYKGFIDKFGDPIVGTPTEDQLEYMDIRKKNDKGEIMGAKEYLQSIEADLIAKGDLRGLAQHQRQHPNKFRECFALATAGNNFNSQILKERVNELKFNKDKKIRKGNYVWTGEKFNSSVTFVDSEEGHWEVSKQLSPGQTNQSIVYDGFNRMPRFDSGFISSADAYRFDETDSFRESKGSIATYEMFNDSLDGDKKDAKEYVTDNFVATYLHREATKELFAEEVLKNALYWNSLVYPEINVTVVQDFFIRHGYRGYLHFDVDENGVKKKNCGFNTAGPTIKQKIFTFVDTWINLHAHKCHHRRLLEECLMIRGPRSTKDYDLFIAMAGCLLGSSSKYTEFVRRFGDTEGVEVGGFFGYDS